MLNELRITAIPEKKAEAAEFLGTSLIKAGCPEKEKTKIMIAFDEIFSNIVKYSGAGKVIIIVDTNPFRAVIRFADDGIEYNPLLRKKPDTTTSLEERRIGGLGIYMVKNIMDSIEYEYCDGKNFLCIEKRYE